MISLERSPKPVLQLFEFHPGSVFIYLDFLHLTRLVGIGTADHSYKSLDWFIQFSQRSILFAMRLIGKILNGSRCIQTVFASMDTETVFHGKVTPLFIREG